MYRRQSVQLAGSRVLALWYPWPLHTLWPRPCLCCTLQPLRCHFSYFTSGCTSLYRCLP